MYHPRDAIIPLEASLFNAMLKEGQPVNALRMPGEIDGHNRPLSEEEKEWHMSMVAQAFTSPSSNSSITADFNSAGYQIGDHYSDGASVSTPINSIGQTSTHAMTITSQSEMMTTDYGAVSMASH